MLVAPDMKRSSSVSMVGRLLPFVTCLLLLVGTSLFRFKTSCDGSPDFDANRKVSTELLGKDTSFDLAYRESLGLFEHVDQIDWMLSKEQFHSDSIFMLPLGEDPKSDGKTALWMFDNVDPMFACPHARRVGGRGDGPKWVCNPHRLRSVPDCLVYSVGSANNYMFEDGLNDIVGTGHCEIHVFDPNPQYERPHDAEQKNM